MRNLVTMTIESNLDRHFEGEAIEAGVVMMRARQRYRLNPTSLARVEWAACVAAEVLSS